MNDEELCRIETEYAKSRFIIKQLKEDESLLYLFNTLPNFQFLEYEKPIQLILYFAGFPNTLINEENTNKLDWKKAKTLWTTKVLDNLESYSPFGSKPSPDSKYLMIDVMIDALNSLSSQAYLDGLRDYSIVISKLLDFLNISNKFIYKIKISYSL